MPTRLTLADYAVFAGFLLATLAVAAWAARGRRSSDDFLTAGRTVPWGLLTFSIAVAGPAALYYCCLPIESYWAGLRVLLVAALVWPAVGLAFWCLVPLYYNLAADSVYEYLELRFSVATRTAAAAIFLVWSLVWLAGLLALPCKVLGLSAASPASTLLVLLAIGLAATLTTLLGGVRSATWTHVLQCLVMVAGLLVVLMAVRGCFEGQVERIWDTARQLGRDTVLDTSWDVSSTWSIWAAGPMLALLPLFFFTADQATAGRLLIARHYRDANRSVLLGSILFCLAVPVVVYVGLGLLAVYHVHAQEEMRPNWVVRSATDPDTGRERIDARTLLDAESIRQLVADRAILDPNTGQPMTDIEKLVDPEGRVQIDRLATWDGRPRPERPRKRIWERRLRRGKQELLGWFVSRHVGPGLAGLVLAGMAAAAMAALGSGLAAMSTVLVVDFHRRLGWGEGWLARRQGKQPHELDEADELRLARPLVITLGILVTALSLALVQVDDLFAFLILWVGLAGGPLLGVFLLGLFTRSTTAPAAIAAMVVGLLVSLWAVLGHYLAGTAALCVRLAGDGPLGICWPLPLGTAATLVTGYVLGLFVGRRKNRTELRGLVAGLGTWGAIVDFDMETEQVVAPDKQEVTWIDGQQEEGPWR